MISHGNAGKCQISRGSGERKEEQIVESKGYIGRIKNSGTQVVKAPHQTTAAKKGTVKKGGDLRSGKK